MIPTCSQDVREAREAELEAQEDARRAAAEHAARCHDGYLIGEAGSAAPCEIHRAREFALRWARSRQETVG